MSKKVAYGGILLAVNIILLLFLNIIPTNTLLIMGLASLPISIVIMEFGPKSGVAFYIASIVLGFIVMTNKSHWVIYVFTFGVYGLIKYIIERDLPVYVEILLKLVFANIVLVFLYFILKPFLYIPVKLGLIAMFEVVFILYDYMYSSFIDYYNNKLKNKLIKIEK
ncbi:hypothetical protein [Asaccharospora irregularis]|uniref:Rod shape-determining protein MreD n=1 Tax=Asaccharospora irregularis DSM 2635 TaxID=1121321 RepID=A0A1M5SF44_9FIRM|nr:hypothetical protein [Asaccharospora irregularis]SHH37174.1 hypothetical protein SAMN04488530_14013 [Asaccharospora irregularis DSM 2635]